MNPPDGAWAQSVRIAFRFLFAVVGFVAVAWALSNIRQVQPDNRAVVSRFGEVVRQQGAGLLIAWPRPIEQIVMLPSADRQIEIRIARFDGAAGAPTPLQADAIPGFDMDDNPRLNAGFLLTGDSSVVHLQASLFYQISDPVAYVTAADHVGPGLERLFIASAVSLCAGRDLDTILVARPEQNQNASDTFRSSREQLRSDLMRDVNRRLENLAELGSGFGVTVGRIDLVPAIPSSAKQEFDRVLVVAQSAEARIAEARTEAEMIGQHANQETDTIVTEATAEAREQVAAASARTAAISALSGQSPGTSRQTLLNRIYFARVGSLLSRMESVETVDREGGAHVILPGPQRK